MTIYSIEKEKFEVKDSIFLGFFDLPPQDDLRDDQYEIAKEIYNSSNNLISCPTGWGKSFLMVYLCKYLPKPILLTAPMNSILEEFEERLKNKNISYSKDLKGKSDVYLINPTGIVARKEFERGLYNETLSKIKTLLTDECMSITPSLQTVIEKLLSCQRFFGFSATLDKYSNKDLSEPRSRQFHNDTCKVLEVFGKALKPVKSNIQVNLIHSKIPICNSQISYTNAYSFNNEYWKLDKIEKSIYKNPTFLFYLSNCYNYSKTPIMIPYKNKNNVLQMFNLSTSLRIRFCIWNSEGLWINNIKFEDKEISPYQRLKELIKNNLIDLIFVSTVSKMGVDFPELRNICLINNSSSGIVLQYIGRATRGDYVNIFLPENTLHNNIYNKQYEKRVKWVESLGFCKVIELEL